MKFPNASKSFQALNPHLFPVAGLPAPKREPDALSLTPRSDADEKGVPVRLTIRIVQFRRRLLDGDNAVFGCKWLRDEIALTLGVDDNDPRLDWQYQQVQVESGPEGVAILFTRR